MSDSNSFFNHLLHKLPCTSMVPVVQKMVIVISLMFAQFTCTLVLYKSLGRVVGMVHKSPLSLNVMGLFGLAKSFHNTLNCSLLFTSQAYRL